MRVAIAGAGKVGKAIARDLVDHGHDVLIIDRHFDGPADQAVEGAAGIEADACEISSLDRAELHRCQVVVAATGDDKVNLVVSLLAKTEYGVPRVVARVNHPKNEWLFNEAWGVDVAVSTPQMLTALVEEAVTVGDLVRLFTFQRGGANLVELTLPHDSRVVGLSVGEVPFPTDTALVAIMRDAHVITPTPDQPLESGDELVFVASADQEPALQALLGGIAEPGVRGV
jgi:trk system potassium uptake protein